MPELSPLAKALREGIDTDTTYGAVVAPIYLSSTYSFERLGVPREYDYSRGTNPNRDQFASAVSTLEGGSGGTVTSTGMSAVTLSLLALTSAGDRVLVPHDVYGGTWRLFDALQRQGHLQVTSVDTADTAATIEALGQLRPRLLWLETPSNPLLRITDIAALSRAAHEAGTVVVVDNTFLTPLGQQPLALGADVVVHSATKFLNGHSDIVGGVVVAADAEVHQQLRWWSNALGVTGSAFDAYLALRGLRTLELRWARHQQNTEQLVAAIAGHSAIERLHFPGLAAHPGHALAASQQQGFGAIFTVELRGGTAAAERFLDGLALFELAVSLGGTESLVSHPATMTHAAMSPEARAAAGIGDGLLRFAIGIEPVADLIADVTAGLDRAGDVG